MGGSVLIINHFTFCVALFTISILLGLDITILNTLFSQGGQGGQDDQGGQDCHGDQGGPSAWSGSVLYSSFFQKSELAVTQ